ncbi:1,6-anhydro-N-acetylmuramyl-L-alanine amidase AmpD [Vibrio sp. S4M6]|uniref:1,6-anhydro-N-acetylmuramyl-L-alanine amidase AmpD n=1 Tax=Vibrio sinus TaxID=2946865 RepID=UPI00202A368B|nr:1,6-anhydro-N-acetylmuramyl-L-alanine amidase AmpD [Vibrio sinus]MCL9781042.1 1,6-anhydro-N-acetylmuramyl-L-alanine amidase AmpD [Vibrio sinus]
MINQTGWLTDVKVVPSPHFDSRQSDKDISLLVIHNINLPPGQFGGDDIEQFFKGELDSTAHPYFAFIHEMKVSAHCLIKRDGEVIQFVSFQDRAWHAGVSSFAGRAQCNDYSIGIELEGSDFVPYTQAQYQSLAKVTREIMQTFPAITLSRITGHQYIAPGRKSDPGLVFDWQKYRGLLTQSESVYNVG